MGQGQGPNVGVTLRATGPVVNFWQAEGGRKKAWLP